MIKVLLVDDHVLFVEGMISMFKPEDGIAVAAHTKNGNEVLSILERESIDIILMDIDMPILNGIATMDLLKRNNVDVPILMLTMHQSIKRIRGSLERGAQGYILKDASKAELLEAIRKVSQRQNYFHPKINDQVFDYFRGKTAAKNALQELSDRETEVIKCLSEGKNTKAIAEALYISEHTVKTHRRNIMQKMRVNTSAELIKLAMDKGLI